MGAEPRRSYAAVDDGLFDRGHVPLTTKDVRSVGELLFDVDYSARQLLIDVTGDDAAHLLAGWPAVVTAAADLWSSMPQHPVSVRAAARNHTIVRLAGVAHAVEARLGTARWPGATEPDTRLVEMATTLSRAADLVRRYRAEISLLRPEPRRDLEAAQARIMHGLYLTAHGVGVSLHQYGRARFEGSRRTNRPLPLSVRDSAFAIPPATEWIRRMAMCEKLAGRYLDGHLTDRLAGEAIRPLEDDTRLAQALASWDIQAHRTLASDTWRANMLLITRTQALTAGATLVLLDAGRVAGRREPDERLTSAIAEAGRAWSHLAGRWADLTSPTARLDPDLIRTAAEVRAAYRELTHDTTTLASMGVIASRPGLTRATAATLHAIESAAELAYEVADKAHADGLTGPARALSIRAIRDTEAGLATPHPDRDFAWVSPADIAARRTVDIPTPVAEALLSTSVSVVQASAAATRAATTTWVADEPDVAPTTPDPKRCAHQEPPEPALSRDWSPSR